MRGREKMIKLLVVDDHEIVRQGIVRMLSDVSGLVVIGEASSGEESVQMVRERQPDVVLMDLQMPGIGGIEAIRRILRIESDIRIIVLTVLSMSPIPQDVMETGAVGYVTKGAPPREMTHAISRARFGKRYISSDIAQQIALQPFSESGGSPFHGLSGREMQIALMVMNCQGVRQIAENLSLSPKTVNSYRYRIFSKLNISSDMELAILSVQQNIIDPHSIPLPGYSSDNFQEFDQEHADEKNPKRSSQNKRRKSKGKNSG